MNRLVKHVIGSKLAKIQMAGENPNWTQDLGMVMASINSQIGKSTYSALSFTSIFGQEYNENITCSKDEAQQCWTVEEQLKVGQNYLLLNNFCFYINMSLMHCFLNSSQALLHIKGSRQ